MNIKKIGSFHTGGKEVRIHGKKIREVFFNPGGTPARLNPNGTYQAEQMYTQFFIPEKVLGKHPLLLWHGTWLTGVTYETTPDGRDGWLNYFIEKGWTVYNSDAVERGRSGWTIFPDIIQGEPLFPTKEFPFERFLHIGQGEGSYNKDYNKMKVLPGNQFPVIAYDDFTKQMVPAWGEVTYQATFAAYGELVKNIGPCIIVAHSQGGGFAFSIGEEYPELVKALIVIEPAKGGDLNNAHHLKDTPILAIYGDYFDGDTRWTLIRDNTMKYFNAIEASGGNVCIIDLPAIGIHGNSHMLMMDYNNLQIADIIINWLKRYCFYQA